MRLRGHNDRSVTSIHRTSVWRRMHETVSGDAKENINFDHVADSGAQNPPGTSMAESPDRASPDCSTRRSSQYDFAGCISRSWRGSYSVESVVGTWVQVGVGCMKGVAGILGM